MSDTNTVEIQDPAVAKTVAKELTIAVAIIGGALVGSIAFGLAKSKVQEIRAARAAKQDTTEK